jgi:transcriptional regulator with GAF, ATPase, and Fis domain
MESVHSFTLIAQSDAMRSILSRIDTVAPTDHSVLLLGETGVGKELIADYIHHTSKRSGRPMVKVGLSALPFELLESELFGHEKGAYTSASAGKKGLFELANGGTIFLDDIDDVPTNIQTKLLRVLESRELMRVGGTGVHPIDVRVISASKVDLKEMVERGSFREDLYFRLNVVPFVIPPLRSRKEDVRLLVEHFIRRFSTNGPLAVDPDALEALSRYPWPGNIRELRNIVQRVSLFAKERITLADLPPEVRSDHPIDEILKACGRCFTNDGMTFEQVVACLEVNLIRQALERSNGNRVQAAKLLKMNPSTLRDKLKKYHLDTA